MMTERLQEMMKALSLKTVVVLRAAAFALFLLLIDPQLALGRLTTTTTTTSSSSISRGNSSLHPRSNHKLTECVDSVETWSSSSSSDGESGELLYEDDDELFRRNAIVPKRVYSNRTRIVFIAGLGGTGHHGWHEVLQTPHQFDNDEISHEKQQQQQAACQFDRGLTEAILALWFARFRNNNSKTRYDAMADKVVDVMRGLDQNNLREKRHGVYCVNAAGTGVGGMMSYPNLNQINDHPNMLPLVELGERAQVDVRIIVIHRHPAPQLVSLTVHRGYMETREEAVQMARQGAIFNSELMSLDPAFYVCTPYDRVVTEFADALNEHMLGGMAFDNPDSLSVALHKYYLISHLDDIDQAYQELEEHFAKNKTSGSIPVQEMVAYYDFLTKVLCPRHQYSKRQ